MRRYIDLLIAYAANTDTKSIHVDCYIAAISGLGKLNVGSFLLSYSILENFKRVDFCQRPLEEKKKRKSANIASRSLLTAFYHIILSKPPLRPNCFFTSSNSPSPL